MPEPDTDELFQVPLAEFVRVRDEIAARRKASGDKEGAAEVRRARKPSVPAWAANQVVWHAPGEWERLLAAAGALRRAHERGAPPDELRRASRVQREALQACESRAADFLVAGGHAATPAVLQRASGTLQTLAYGSSDADPGRVREELAPPGFELLAGLSLAVPDRLPAEAALPGPEPSPPGHPDEVSAAAAKAIAAAEDRVAQARGSLAAARRRVEDHQQRLRALETELATERRACDEARRALGEAEAEESSADAVLGSLRQAGGARPAHG
jgi:hypothetical protein